MLSRLSVVVWSAAALIVTLYFAMAVTIKTTPDISYGALVVIWLAALGAIYGLHRVTWWVLNGKITARLVDCARPSKDEQAELIKPHLR